MSSNAQSTNSPLVGRRTVTRAAAHAAWAVPAIQVATSVPAFATSSPNALEVGGATFAWNTTSTRGDATLTIRNTGSSDAATVAVTVSFPPHYCVGNFIFDIPVNVTVSNVSTLWTASGVSYDPSSTPGRTGHVSFTSTSALPAGQSRQLQFRFDSGRLAANGSVPLPVVATAATFATGTGSIVKA